MVKGACSQSVFFFTEALAEFHHVNCMIVRIWEVKTVAFYARAETFSEAIASVASMVALPLVVATCNMIHAAVAIVLTCSFDILVLQSEMSIICKVYSTF